MNFHDLNTPSKAAVIIISSGSALALVIFEGLVVLMVVYESWHWAHVRKAAWFLFLLLSELAGLAAVEYVVYTDPQPVRLACVAVYGWFSAWLYSTLWLKRKQ